MILTRTFTPDLGADAGDRSLVGLAVPFDTPTEVRDGTGRPYIEAIRADAIDPAEVVGIPVAWRHDEPIGRITDAAAEPAGLNVSLDLADTALGRDATALADLGILGMSIGFRPLESSEDGGTTYRDRIQITEVSLTHQPAYPNTEAATREDTIPMTDTTTTDPAAPTPDPMIRDAVDTLDARMADLTQRVAQLPTHTAAAEVPELARDYGSAGEYVLAVARGDETRALVDQVSPDNPGVWPESWLGGITGIINRGRPFIGGIGGPGSLPATGDEVAWPVYEGGFDLFAEQSHREDRGC